MECKLLCEMVKLPARRIAFAVKQVYICVMNKGVFS